MKTVHHQYGINLSEGQLKSLANAYKDHEAITIRLTYEDLSGSHKINLTNRQINRIKKGQHKRQGTDLNIRKTQIRKALPKGGNIFKAIMPLITRVASKVLPAVGLSSLMGASEAVMKKLLGGCYNQSNALSMVCYETENDRIPELVENGSELLRIESMTYSMLYN